MSQLNPNTLTTSTVLYPSPRMVSGPTFFVPFPSAPLHACAHHAHVHDCGPHWAQFVVLGHKCATCEYQAKCQWPRKPWGRHSLKPALCPAKNSYPFSPHSLKSPQAEMQLPLLLQTSHRRVSATPDSMLENTIQRPGQMPS